MDPAQFQQQVQPQPPGTDAAVTVNGQPANWSPNLTVEQLLQELGIDNPAIAIEVNGELVPRPGISGTTLQPGDRVEIVTLTGGG